MAGIQIDGVNNKIDFDDDADTSISSSTDDVLVFETAGSERMRINSAGRVGIGTTNGDHVFQVRGAATAGSDAFLLQNTLSSGTMRGLQINYSAQAPDDSNPAIIYEDSSAVRFRVNNDGDVKNHDNSYGSTSDERIKEGIRDANSQWDDIKAVKVRNFKHKSDIEQYGDKAREQIGVIAQELESSGMDKLVKDEVLDEDGNITEHKTVKYSILYMKAVKALQEAMAKIETLETKVKALEDA